MVDLHPLVAALLCYLLCINALTFFTMAKDKRAAIRGERRTPERTLFKLVWLGGGLGGCLAMGVLRHKTQKTAFIYGFPIITVVTFAALFFILATTVNSGEIPALW